MWGYTDDINKAGEYTEAQALEIMSEPHTNNTIEEVVDGKMSKLEELKKGYPELVDEYSKMDKDTLLEQICAEVLDLHRMEERVSVFMELCTRNMSKTNYTPESIRTLVNEKQQYDIDEFCFDISNGVPDGDIVSEVKNRANNI